MRVPTFVVVWDGQTIAMQSSLSQTNASAAAADSSRRLLILITPCLIDPVGNRIHTDEELNAHPAIPPK